MSDFGETTKVVGRKDYRCEWCGENIPKGEAHRHYGGMWEGNWQNWRMHEECYLAGTKSDDMQDGWEPYTHARGKIEQK